jgi:hypothetical protein
MNFYIKLWRNSVSKWLTVWWIVKHASYCKRQTQLNKILKVWDKNHSSNWQWDISSKIWDSHMSNFQTSWGNSWKIMPPLPIFYIWPFLLREVAQYLNGSGVDNSQVYCRCLRNILRTIIRRFQILPLELICLDWPTFTCGCKNSNLIFLAWVQTCNKDKLLWP